MANAAFLELYTEEVIELQRQIWTTHTNLSDWFDSWEAFLVSQGFATDITSEDGDQKEVVVSEDQKCCKINIDGKNLSLNGSDGGCEGGPGCTITIKHCSRPRTAQNKRSVSSSLMCGSNPVGESIPMHIVFSSNAKEEANYAANASWIVDLPQVTGQCGHGERKTFPSYLFPGAQNATHIMQETDQNYGDFKSLLRKHIQQLLNVMFDKYRELQNQERQGGEALPSISTLNCSRYEILLSGNPADQKKGIRKIPLIFYHFFSKEKNLKSWKACVSIQLRCSLSANS